VSRRHLEFASRFCSIAPTSRPGRSENSAVLTLSGSISAEAAGADESGRAKQIQVAPKAVSRINSRLCLIDPSRRESLSSVDTRGSRVRGFGNGSARFVPAITVHSKVLGPTVPLSLLGRADEVIK
jgi:hypothetical protein